MIVWGFRVKGSHRRGNHPQRLQLLFVHLICDLKLLLSQKTGLQQLLRIPTTPATTPLPPTAHLRYLNHGHLPHDPPLRKHLGTDSSIEPTELAKSRRGRLKIQVALRGVQVYLQRVGVVEGRQAQKVGLKGARSEGREVFAVWMWSAWSCGFAEVGLLGS